MEARQDFKELLECFNEHNVRYLIIGAFALAWHGHPRYTGDLDIYIDPAPANAARTLSALTDLGFGSLGLTQADFETPDRVVQLGIAPVRVDILTSISGVDWSAAWSGSVPGTYADVAVRYLGKEQYRANKLASGRAKDLADLESLKE
jgi:hypothetical protein